MTPIQAPYVVILSEKAKLSPNKGPIMTFEEIFELVSQRKAEMPEGSWTTHLFQKGAHGIGKKLVEESAEAWMAARFETKEECAEELSQVLYYVACMMAETGLSLDEVYKTL